MPLYKKSAPIPVVPSVNDPALRMFLEAVSRALIYLTGQKGVLAKSAVLYEDLESLGYVTLSGTYGSSRVVADGTLTSTSSTEEDLSVPPTPTNLTAQVGMNSVTLSFDGFTLPTDNVASVEVYRSTTDDAYTAVFVGSVYGYSFLDSTITTNDTYYYWAKSVSPAGVASEFNAIAGVSVTITDSPLTMTENIVQRITEQQTSGYGVETLKINRSLFAIQNMSGVGVEYPFIISIVNGVTKIAFNAATYIPDLAVTRAKIAALAVDNAQIDDATIDNAKFNTAAITEAKIAALTIESAKIDDLNVETLKIAGQAVFIPAYYKTPPRYEAFPGTVSDNLQTGSTLYSWDFQEINARANAANKNIYVLSLVPVEGRYYGPWLEVFEVNFPITDTIGNLTIDFRDAEFLPIYDLFKSGVTKLQVEIGIFQDEVLVYSRSFTPFQVVYPSGGFSNTTTRMYHTGMASIAMVGRAMEPNDYDYVYTPRYNQVNDMVAFPRFFSVPTPNEGDTLALRYRFYSTSVPASAYSILLPLVPTEISTNMSSTRLPYVRIQQAKK